MARSKFYGVVTGKRTVIGGEGVEGQMDHGRISVAVVGCTDIYRLGTVEVLHSAGYQVEEPTDGVRWAAGRCFDQSTGAIVFLAPATGCAGILRLRAANPSLAIVVVLLMDCSPAMSRCVEVLRAGAGGVLAGDADGATLLAGLGSVLQGLAVLPLPTTSRAAGHSRRSAVAHGHRWRNPVAAPTELWRQGGHARVIGRLV